MKAVYFESYGGPEVWRFGERPAPVAGPGEVLVAVKAASVNPIDWKIAAGLLRGALDLSLPYVMGRDFSGVVAAVGAEVTGIAPGDAVFGMANTVRGGTHAEFVVTLPHLLAPKPANLTHAEAASLPLVGASTMIALEDTAHLAAGERVLVHGGAGGVGAFAVQLARHDGAWVAATCSAANRDYVRSLGAEQTIDYAHEDFAAVLSGIDVVLDTMGGDIHRRSMTVLKPGGRLVYLSAAPIPPGPPPAGITVQRADIRPQLATIKRIAHLAETGAIAPQVGAVLPLADALRAYEINHSGKIRGKVVIEVAG